MPGEKQNNIKQKLELLSAVPLGFHFQKEEAWQKLEPKLHSNRKRFLWVPAAAVLLVLFATYFFMRSYHSKPQPAIAIVQTISQPVKKNTTLAAPVSPQKATAVFKSKVVLSKIKALLPVIDMHKLPDTLVAQLPQLKTPLQLLLPPATDTVLTASLQTKPRFKIAHVNELNSSPTSMPDETKKTFAFSLRRTSPVVSDEALTVNENPVVQRKPRTLFSSSLNAPQ